MKRRLKLRTLFKPDDIRADLWIKNDFDFSSKQEGKVSSSSVSSNVDDYIGLDADDAVKNEKPIISRRV